MSSNKKALITRVTGQDGSYLAEFLIGKGYEVHGIIRINSPFNTGGIEHLYADKTAHSGGSMHLHYGDLTDSTCLVKIISQVRPTEIYNIGAQSHAKVSFDLAEYTANVDAVGTLRLLDAIRTCGLSDQVKFYQASTSEMFGKVQEIPQKETTPFYPRSPYGVAKLYAYWIVVNYREAYNMFACNGILFNHESPRRCETFVTRKITRAVAKISLCQQKHLELGNLDAKRDWGHAKDYVEVRVRSMIIHPVNTKRSISLLAALKYANTVNLVLSDRPKDEYDTVYKTGDSLTQEAMWLMLQQDKPEDFVISMNEAHSVREFVVETFKRVGVEVVWEGEGVDEVGKNKATGDVLIKVNPNFYRPTEAEFLLGDSTKAKTKLQWVPKYTFDSLVGEMIDADIALMKSGPMAKVSDSRSEG